MPEEVAADTSVAESLRLSYSTGARPPSVGTSCQPVSGALPAHFGKGLCWTISGLNFASQWSYQSLTNEVVTQEVASRVIRGHFAMVKFSWHTGFNIFYKNKVYGPYQTQKY